MLTIKKLTIGMAITLLTAVLGYSVEENQLDKSAKNKEVDIRVPAGSLKMTNKTDGRDLGMAIYPGARLKPDSPADHNSSNVNFSVASSLFGLKLVVQKYQSDDSASHIQRFYEKELAKFGAVTKSEGGTAVSEGDEEYQTELKTGSEHNQHIVAIKSLGSGSSFALVHVRVQGDEKK